ncbi:MAG: glycosyl hydrolase family 25 [Prevotella sp.]|nr:glycosyl hydrolase family 25 [Prevotella sp.]
MKKTLLSMIAAMGALMGVGHLVGTPALAGMRLAETYAATQTTPDTPKITDPKMQEELKYYLDRHNVQDEGYEMVVAFADGKRIDPDLESHISVMNVGTWKNHRREGAAIVLDSLRRTIVGTCLDDSLVTGVRADSTSIYVGDFRQTKAHGHGALYADGSYHEGHWENDRRQGFGLQLLTPANDTPRLRVGEWNKDKFQGERMRYTSERIYGIDIARYQHGKGRRPVPIHWDKLRITSVGKNGSHNIRGTADYPVSFIYIKSTEGTSVRNKFYVNDYAQARKHGIRAGAYHFFSVKSSGAAQAKHFIRNTLFREGDLPPVLDIEPSNAQIRQMGGPEAMFSHIRTWLREVERWTKVKPILYVNQMFVNNYLSQQPDLKRNYRIWIARYSEYKPDLRLTYWQLCPDGRVAGIQGYVDINVFNGYQRQFEEFLAEETIK